ncbi:ABC transporter permease [uncultured Clostridium sp.]|uniref:ABC transporter permease n=1 Tax=uncultured Clostridium sp. TaxID=59620 RepID=UPI003457C433
MNLQKSDFKIIGNKGYLNNLKENKNLKKIKSKRPYISFGILGVIILLCIFAEGVMTHDPSYLNLRDVSSAPSSEFLFGTDTMGRDIFSMIWYGGRISLFIGFLATLISTVIAIIYGTVSACSNSYIDDLMMRITEIILTIPSILVIIFIQGMLGESSVISLAFIIGITSWMNMAKVVRAEVSQIKHSEYILASKTMGAGFFHILKEHMILNFIPAIMFMVVTSIAAAIGTEATLSFLGIGLPIDSISWGSMLSLADSALLSNLWWIIIIPGFFLVITLLCITNIGNYLRGISNKKQSNL